MRFTLTYTGELRANAGKEKKHEIRKHFHSQLQELWHQEPLSDHTPWFDGSNPKVRIDLNRRIGTLRFVPLVSKALHLICELKIFMLRPEVPGSLITQGGDIDNRIKTLFDALRIPTSAQEIPSTAGREATNAPFFCLLEDDNLITAVSVKTDRLLLPDVPKSEVRLFIQVETRPTRMLCDSGRPNTKTITGGALIN